MHQAVSVFRWFGKVDLFCNCSINLRHFKINFLIMNFIKSRKIDEGHMTQVGEMRNAYKTLVSKQ
jgi:hypothetical protein